MSEAAAGERIWAADGSDAAVIACLARHLKSASPKLALPGGATPVGILTNSAAGALDWAGAEIWPTDERDVPADHPASNGAMLSQALGETGVVIHRLAEGGTLPAFDLVWLGVGMDGHIASIFPSASLPDMAPAGVAHLTPDPLPPEAPFARHTLTMRALTNAREIILVIRGDAKRIMLEQAFSDDLNVPVVRLARMAPCPITIYWSGT